MTVGMRNGGILAKFPRTRFDSSVFDFKYNNNISGVNDVININNTIKRGKRRRRRFGRNTN